VKYLFLQTYVHKPRFTTRYIKFNPVKESQLDDSVLSPVAIHQIGMMPLALGAKALRLIVPASSPTLLVLINTSAFIYLSDAVFVAASAWKPPISRDYWTKYLRCISFFHICGRCALLPRKLYDRLFVEILVAPWFFKR